LKPGLFVHRSNRLEQLADRLGTLLEEPLPSPLQAETIVVQSLGMRRWLALTLARQLGISMNCQFPFPHALAHRIFRAAFRDLAEESAFSRDVLPWRIDALLPDLVIEPVSADLNRYIGTGDRKSIKQFQLSRQLATLYDRHLVHRAEDLLRWEATEPPHNWQELLWQALVHGHEGDHPPALLDRLLKRIESGDTSLPEIPPRVSVFGISSLPRYYIDLLNAVAQCVELHLFLFEPTDQYWGDIQSVREQRRFLRRHAQPGQTAEDFHLETGNSLLASLGKPGRLFADEIQRLDPNGIEELFEPPERTSLLSNLQADLFELRDSEPDRLDFIRTDDRSIQIHCCHGPMREVEILHDQLLALFEEIPELTPKDILVMSPDVEKYAPFIEAVFASPEDESLRIPFTIADRSASAENASARALLQLLSLHGSRFGAATVLGVLELPPVQRRFDLTDADLEIIRNWVEDMRIRWGIDAVHREELGVPAFAQNSWRQGLDRLLLGYALPGDGVNPFEEILPAEGIEGSMADILGSFSDFTGKLFEMIPRLGEPRTLEEWEHTLGQLLTAFLDDSEESADEIHQIRQALEKLGSFNEIHPQPVAFEVIQAHLAHVFSDTDSGRGFLVGHVTFCSLKPMRSIPFKVICMLGMNDTDFPRRDPGGMLDQLAGVGLPGRSRRDEDRQVFLESLLSARHTFYLSYSGLSTRDNSEAPPSVVVSELLDYLNANYQIEGKSIAESIRVKHRLQPFSPAYFSGKDRDLFSYSQENCRASRELDAVHLSQQPLIDAPLPEPGQEWLTVPFSDLQRFFHHPSKFFLTRRLSLRLPDSESLMEESEPLTMEVVDRWRVQQDLAGRLFAGEGLSANLRAIRAEGVLPFGYPGSVTLRDVCLTVDPLVQRMQAATLDEPLPPEPLILQVGQWKLTGTVNDRYPAGIVRLTAWNLTPRERLSAWIDHLLLCAAQPEQTPATRLFATDRTLDLAFAAEASSLLSDLLAIYWEGLREPAPYFPRSSFELARRKLRPKPAETSVENAARQVFFKDESGDPHFELCFRGREPLGDAWQALAVRLWKPFFDHATETQISK